MRQQLHLVAIIAELNNFAKVKKPSTVLQEYYGKQFKTSPHIG